MIFIIKKQIRRLPVGQKICDEKLFSDAGKKNCTCLFFYFSSGVSPWLIDIDVFSFSSFGLIITHIFVIFLHFSRRHGRQRVS